MCACFGYLINIIEKAFKWSIRNDYDESTYDHSSEKNVNYSVEESLVIILRHTEKWENSNEFGVKSSFQVNLKFAETSSFKVDQCWI